MRVLNKTNGWLPTILDDLLIENRLDVPNYENFSIPKVNISENFTNFVVALAVPGLKKSDFLIEVEDKTLKVSAKITTEEEQTETKDTIKYTRKEFNYKNFSRSFVLPETVDVEDIKATYEDGILSIVLPKLEEKKELKKMVEIS